MMKISTMALAAALLAGAGGLSPAAVAARDEQPNSAAPLVLSKQVRTSALAADTALKAGNLPAAETAVSAVEGNARNDSERFVARTLRVKLLSASPQTGQSLRALIQPLDALIGDPLTPREDIARYSYARGDIAFALKEYAKAVQYYLQARQNGLRDDELGLQIVRANMEAGTVSAGAAELDALIRAQIAAGKRPPESWYRFASQRLRAKNAPEAAAWTGKWLAAYGTRENWHDAIAINGYKDEDESKLTPAQRRERDWRFVDLLRLMRVTHSLAGQKDYMDYARRANNLGLREETKAVIEEGRASGAIPPDDASSTQILGQAKRPDPKGKLSTPQEAAARKSAKGELAAQLGDASIGRSSYAKAIEMYGLALSKGVSDQEAVHLHRGIAYALSGDKEKARADFNAVTLQPARETATLWTIWLDAPPAS